MKYKSSTINILIFLSFISLGGACFVSPPFNHLLLAVSLICLFVAITLRNHYPEIKEDNDEDMVEFQVDLPDDLYNFLDEEAKKKGITADEFASQIVIDYVKYHCNEDGSLKDEACHKKF